MNTYTLHIPEITNDNRANIMCNSYRFGMVNMLELEALSAEVEAKAKAKVARTGKPVTIRMNVGIYEVFTTSGHYQIEKELEEDGYGQRETGWWICSEYNSDGFLMRDEPIHPTLRDAKAYVISIS